MKRRNFVKHAALAAAAAAIKPAFAFEQEKLKIGIQLYTVRYEVREMGIEPVLAKLASIGYQTVEMYDYKDGKYFGKDIKSMAALLKQYHLSSPSAHLGIDDFLYHGNDDAWKKAATDAAMMHQQYMVVPHLDEKYRRTVDDYKKIAARLNKAAEISKAAGMKFAYHNHAFEFGKLGETSGYEVLLSETDPALVKMEMDIYWVVNAGLNPIDLIEKNPGRITMWHVKDMDKNNRNSQTEVGNGSIDFKAIFAKQKISGLEYFFVEQENYDYSPFDSIEKCFSYVKQNLV
jgi:sugar phosphate isomerase/epimerase